MKRKLERLEEQSLKENDELSKWHQKELQRIDDLEAKRVEIWKNKLKEMDDQQKNKEAQLKETMDKVRAERTEMMKDFKKEKDNLKHRVTFALKKMNKFQVANSKFWTQRAITYLIVEKVVKFMVLPSELQKELMQVVQKEFNIVETELEESELSTETLMSYGPTTNLAC